MSLLGFVAAGIGVTCSLPQVLVLLRSSHAQGLSFGSCVLGVLSSSAWLMYGVLLLDPAQLIANLPGLTGAAVIAWLVAARQGLRIAPALTATLLWLAALGAVASTSGPSAVGLVATAVTLVSRGPQLVAAFGGGSLAALAPASFVLSIVSSMLWVSYGMAVGQTPTWVCSLVMAVLSAVILSRRCPPRRVVVALHHGRWGTPGRLLVRPVAVRLAA